MNLARVLIVVGLIGALASSLAVTAGASEAASYRWSDRTPTRCGAQMTEEVYFHPACAPAKNGGFRYSSEPREGTARSTLPETGVLKVSDTALYAFAPASNSTSNNGSASDKSHRRHKRTRNALLITCGVVVVYVAVRLYLALGSIGAVGG